MTTIPSIESAPSFSATPVAVGMPAMPVFTGLPTTPDTERGPLSGGTRSCASASPLSVSPQPASPQFTPPQPRPVVSLPFAQLLADNATLQTVLEAIVAAPLPPRPTTPTVETLPSAAESVSPNLPEMEASLRPSPIQVPCPDVAGPPVGGTQFIAFVSPQPSFAEGLTQPQPAPVSPRPQQVAALPRGTPEAAALPRETPGTVVSVSESVLPTSPKVTASTLPLTPPLSLQAPVVDVDGFPAGGTQFIASVSPQPSFAEGLTQPQPAPVSPRPQQVAALPHETPEAAALPRETPEAAALPREALKTSVSSEVVAPTALPVSAVVPGVSTPSSESAPSIVTAVEAVVAAFAPSAARAVEPAQVLVEAARAVADTLLVTPGLLRGEGEIRIQLRPDVLDGTEIHIAVAGRQLTVAFTPPTPELAALIEQSRPQLTAHLAERIHSFQIAVDVRRRARSEERG